MQTIVAIATPPGRGGLGIVRLSGDDAASIASKVVRLHSPLRSRSASFGHLIDAEGAVVDQVIVTYFQAPRSFTGEDVVEVSCHGAPVLLRFAVEQCLLQGASHAKPGEFTLRAFIHGKLDLPQAEAVRDLIAATTLYQARVAALQVEGSVANTVKPVKDKLVELIALLEAGIDFAEDDVSIAPDADILARLDPVIENVSRLVASYAYGRMVHEGISLAIVGRPNAGKSSLFNRLLKQDRAIVTEVPGTTRDVVAETYSLDGLPVRLMDTAGIRIVDDQIERLGIERSLQAMADADLTLVVIDRSEPTGDEDRQILARAASFGRALVVLNKSDLPARASFEAPDQQPAIEVSAVTGAGIDDLRKAILTAVGHAASTGQEFSFITSMRQARCLEESLAALKKTREAVLASTFHELLLIDLYDALRPLDELTGATTADDILNRIFSTFCIGK